MSDRIRAACAGCSVSALSPLGAPLGSVSETVVPAPSALRGETAAEGGQPAKILSLIRREAAD